VQKRRMANGSENTTNLRGQTRGRESGRLKSTSVYSWDAVQWGAGWTDGTVKERSWTRGQCKRIAIKVNPRGSVRETKRAKTHKK